MQTKWIAVKQGRYVANRDGNSVPLIVLSLIAGLLSPAVAQAQIITISRADIERRVETGVECYIHPDGPGCAPAPPNKSRPDCSLYWASGAGSADRVRVSRKDSKSVRADVHLKCAINNLPNPDVYIHLDLRFSCNLPNPSVKTTPVNVDIEVDWPWYVDLYTATISWWIGNFKSRTITSSVRASGALQRYVDERMVPITYCPGISVQANGDLQIDLATGNECMDGETKHRNCTGNTYGPGYDYVCVGGRWNPGGGWCEPKPPPGANDRERTSPLREPGKAAA